MPNQQTKAENQKLEREVGRIVAGGHTDLQKARIAATNQLRTLIRAKNEGIDMSKPEEKKEAKTHDKKYSDDNLFILVEEMLIEGKITEEEHTYITTLKGLIKGTEASEKNWLDLLKKYTADEPYILNG
jgi:hypothetical protein